MNGEDQTGRFEQLILAHLDAAHNLARWLTGNDHDAQDIVQEACLRAFRSFDGFRGGNGRAWLLTIVRNTSYTWLQQHRVHSTRRDCDDELDLVEDVSVNPELLQARAADIAAVQQAIAQLPVEFREIVILREMEGFSYKEIADLAGLPIGTVMSRLARARKQLQIMLTAEVQPTSKP